MDNWRPARAAAAGLAAGAAIVIAALAAGWEAGGPGVHGDTDGTEPTYSMDTIPATSAAVGGGMPEYSMDDPYLGLLDGAPPDGATPYERRIGQLRGAADELERMAAGRGGWEAEAIKSAMYAVRKNLEAHGVAGPEEFQKNPHYWEQRAAAARDWLDSGAGASVAGLVAGAGLGTVEPSVDVDDPYREILRRDNPAMPPGELEALVVETRGMWNRTAYEREVWRIMEAAARMELEAAEGAGDQMRADLIDAELYALERALESYGLAAREEVQKNRSYWMYLSEEVREAINGRAGS